MDSSIDLNKIYHNAKTNISNNNDLSELISKYYHLDSFLFDNNNEIYINHFIDKFNFDYDDLLIFDRLKLNDFLESPNQYLDYNKGLILFNLSDANNDLLINNINFLLSNYDDINLNKFYDNYVLYFNDKNEKQINQNQINLFNENLKNIFAEDIKDLLLWQKVQNIPNVIKNNNISKKLHDDLSYYGIKQNMHFDNYDLKPYEDSLLLDLNSNNYQVNYDFTNSKFKKIDPEIHSEILNKFNDYNTYLNNILDELNIDKTDKIINRSDNFVNTIELNDLFNQHKINNLYYHLKKNNNIIMKMNDINDKTIEIYNNDMSDRQIDQTQFTNHIILFINELMKAKIKKTMKLFNSKMIKN